MTDRLNDAALDQLFRQARTHNAWTDREVPEALLHEVYELFKWGPTAANSCPARLLFVTSSAAKARLKPALSDGNLAKTLAAPVTCIVAYDLEFYEQLPKLFPHTDARSWYVDSPQAAEKSAFRNGTLQGAYLMMAARSLGLDCGPMSGFDNAAVDKAFFADAPRHRSNFICSIGYGDPASIFERSPRPDFDKFNRIA